MIIGHMRDLPKVEKCDTIILNSNLSDLRKWTCEREGEAVPWGLSHSKKYFAQMLRRVGGG